jgi:putative glutamine amidotransferase
MTYRIKPVVGVTPAFDEGYKLPASRATLYLRREYTQLLSDLGAVPIILTPDMPLEYILEMCDGIIISGGEDIPAEVYGGDPWEHATEPLERIMWEQLLVGKCEERAMPILGVCYGMQLIALHYGGGLYQDIERCVAGNISHHLTEHAVAIQTDFLGFQKGDVPTVCSRHHQAVATLPDSFTLCATAPDGVIEAMKYKDIYGVQWHPEPDETGYIVYHAFIERCGAYSIYKQG